MASKNFRRRFGSLAVEKGFITLEQLFEAIKVQILEEVGADNHRLLGAILLEQNLITNPQIDSLLTSLGKSQN